MDSDDLVMMSLARKAGSGEGRALRLAADVSLREAADCLGISSASLSRYERGLNRPKGRRAIEYGRLLGLWMVTANA